MFDKDKSRYITKGIKHKISPFIYLMLWEMVDDMVMEKDYLQIFDLRLSEQEEGLQEIVHTQEESQISTVKFYTNFGVNAKIYIIDTGEYSTMLLAEEF